MASKIAFKATPKQWQALAYLADKVTTDIWYGGAAWWGKSWIWVFWIWMMCIKYPWTRRFFWRKELTNLTKTTLATYYKVLDTYEIVQKARWKLDWKNNIIKFYNKSEIYLLDLAYKPADPLYARLWSMEFTWWFIDESAEVAASAIDILKTRLWRQLNQEYGLKPKLLQTFNPDKWHVYSEFYKPYKSWTLPEWKVFIPALVTDNSYISQDYIEQLKKADEVTKQRLLYGNFDFDDTEWKVFRTDEILDLFDNVIEPDTTTYISADIARLGKDSTRIVVWRWLEAIKIFKLKEKTTDYTAQFIKGLENEYQTYRGNIVVDTDWLWAWVADQLRGCYQFHNGASPIKTETEAKFWNLKAQCYYKLRDYAEKRKIKINADWVDKDNLIQELENILDKNRWTDQRVMLESKDDMKARIGRSPDIADAIMMRMVFELEWLTNVQTYKAFFDEY